MVALVLIVFLALGAIGGVIVTKIERKISARMHALIGGCISAALAYFIGSLLLAALPLTSPWLWVCVMAGLLFLLWLFMLSRR